MALYKEKDGAGFEQVPNDLIRTASIKATGMWCFIAQLPEGWNFSVQGLAKVMKEGKDAISSAIHELEALGYLVRRQSKNVEGKFSNSDWELRYHSCKPSRETPFRESPHTDCQSQYKYLNNKDLKKKIPKDKEIYGESRITTKNKSCSNQYASDVGGRLMKKWNEKFAGSVTVRPISRLTDKRIQGIKARLNDSYSPEDLEKAIDMAADSPWCTSGKWGFGFDWVFCCKNNIQKLLEGTYNQKSGDNLMNEIIEASYNDPDYMALWNKENPSPFDQCPALNKRNLAKLDEMKRKALGVKYD